MRTRLRAAQWLSVLLLAYAGAGHAALGGAAETFDTQASTLVAGVSAAGTAYLVRNTLLATGTRVSEYVSAGGVVFAVTWDGPMLPDLKVLLGKHFDTMVAESARRPVRGPWAHRAGYARGGHQFRRPYARLRRQRLDSGATAGRLQHRGTALTPPPAAPAALPRFQRLQRFLSSGGRRAFHCGARRRSDPGCSGRR